MIHGGFGTSTVRHMNSFALILTIFLILGGASIVPVSGDDATLTGDEGPTREEEVVPDFDVQFMIEPDDDPLSPFTNQKWSKIHPGSEIDYWVMISNMGPRNDTFHLHLSPPDHDRGWEWFFVKTKNLSIEIDLLSPGIRDDIGGISFKTFVVKVQCPVDASRDPRIPLKVTAVSEMSLEDHGPTGIVDSDEIHLVVGDSYIPRIPLTGQRIYYTDPGEWITIPLFLTNLGNKDVINVEMTIDEDDFWRTSYRDYENIYFREVHFLEFNWTTRSVSIPQGQTINSEIKVRTNPHWMGEDDVFRFRVYGRVNNFSIDAKSDIITIIINKWTNLEPYLPGGNDIEVPTGVSRTVDLIINNTYHSGDVILDIFMLEPDGIDLHVVDTHFRSLNRKEVYGHSYVRFYLNLSTREFLPPGEYRRTLIIDSMYFGRIHQNITISVPDHHLLRILPTDPVLDETIELGPEGEKRITLGVRNEGNSVDDFTLEVLKSLGKGVLGDTTPVDKGWNCEMEWVSWSMEPPNFLELQGPEGPVKTYMFDPDVGYLISHDTDPEDLRYYIAPGETLWFCFSVRAPEQTGTLLIDPYPVKFILDPGEDGNVTVLDRVLEVKYPDLEFKGMLILRNEEGGQITGARPGERVFFEVNVSNEGIWYSQRAWVRIRDGEITILDIWVKPLAPGDWVILRGNFTACNGIERILFEMDPENDIVESDDQFMEGSSKHANLIGAPLIVETDNNEGISRLWPVIVISVILSVVILLTASGGVLYIRRRDRR
ncbi:MAG: hypothetical protein ACMUHB_03645 [Thermoplasmatota archaeon]